MEQDRSYVWPVIPQNTPKRRTWTLEDPGTWEADESDEAEDQQ
jgi:hypothetical protein